MKKFDKSFQSCYTCLTVKCGGDGMTPAEIIKDLLSKSEIQQNELGEKMGWSEVAISNRLKRDAFSAKSFIEMLDILGYRIEIVGKETGRIERERRKGVGERIKMMVGGIKYDTAKADAICHSDTGECCFYELYRDDSGRYFVAQYANWNGGVNSISPIGEDDALKMMKMLGAE